MKLPFLIVGLGNPGKKYQKTRHNVGFMVVDFLAAQFNESFDKFQDIGWVASITHNNYEVILLKPATYMNLSGVAVAAGICQYNVVLSNLLIICDDINLTFGTIRIRPKGSDGGQKGLRSIIQELGTQEFPRLRIGIGNHFEDASDYVLSVFNKAEQKELSVIIHSAGDAALSFIHDGVELTMSRFNRNYIEI
jgi:PTH1 family peptidyl-tRNA hydrolase